MDEWVSTVQKLLDWIDDHVTDNPSLTEISRQVGYSPWYCSEQFHRISDMTIKEYIAKRRLSLAALALRDTQSPLIDIAMEYGFSSQQALTRAFTAAYGCAPSAYRKNPVPIPLTMKKTVINPSNYSKGDCIMSNLVIPSYRMEYIPAHRFLGVYDCVETKDGTIWSGHDCVIVVLFLKDLSSLMSFLQAITLCLTIRLLNIWVKGGSGADGFSHGLKTCHRHVQRVEKPCPQQSRRGEHRSPGGKIFWISDIFGESATFT